MTGSATPWPTWRPFSQSNPVPGIEQALRAHRVEGARTSIYVIGDEFTGESIQSALDGIARLNAADPRRARARIHAIGFPGGSRHAAVYKHPLCCANEGSHREQ